MFNISFFAFAPPQPGSDPTSQLLSTGIMFLSIMLIFYFMILRPQKKRQDEQKKMLETLKKGDKIVLSSGIHGSISDVEDTIIVVQIAENVKVRVDKAAITTVMVKQ